MGVSYKFLWKSCDPVGGEDDDRTGEGIVTESAISQITDAALNERKSVSIFHQGQNRPRQVFIATSS